MKIRYTHSPVGSSSLISNQARRSYLLTHWPRFDLLMVFSLVAGTTQRMYAFIAKEYQKGMDTNMILMVDITESKIIRNAPSTDSFQSVSLTRSEERKKKVLFHLSYCTVLQKA